MAVFSSGHFLRVLIARWLGLDPSAGGYFKVGTAALTVLGYDYSSTSEPVIRLLNERPLSRDSNESDATVGSGLTDEEV